MFRFLKKIYKEMLNTSNDRYKRYFKVIFRVCPMMKQVFSKKIFILIQLYHGPNEPEK